jgi:hypothetical protein
VGEKEEMSDTSMLGSPFEMSLRSLLMLDELIDIELDEQRICAIDFIAVYAADFNLLDENLHGYGNYRYSEYPARKNLVREALKVLVLDGTVSFFPNQNGFTYRISESGHEVCKGFIGSYAEEYRIAVRAVSMKYDISNGKSLLNIINHYTIRSLQEVYDE